MNLTHEKDLLNGDSYSDTSSEASENSFHSVNGFSPYEEDIEPMLSEVFNGRDRM